MTRRKHPWSQAPQEHQCSPTTGKQVETAFHMHASSRRCQPGCWRTRQVSGSGLSKANDISKHLHDICNRKYFAVGM